MKYRMMWLMGCCAWTVTAQDFPREQVNFQHLADEIFGFQDTDLDHEDLQENLMQYLAHPLELNTATPEDLRSLQVLSDEQIKNLIHHREQSGNFISIYELQAIPGFELSDVYRLVSFVKVADPTSLINATLFSRIRSDGENYFLIRYSMLLQQKEGFTTPEADNRFEGTPSKVYLRFRTSKPGDFSFGLTAEKDEGERIQWSPSQKIYGFDYLSFHGQLINKKRIKNLIVGDFQTQFGQGLTLGGGFGMGKGGETITSVRRSNIGFTPYTSVYEAGGFRGIGATLKISERLLWSGFVSGNRRDANPDITNGTISAFQYTGLHRTRKELAMRKSIQEQNAGAVMQYQSKALDAGVIAHFLQYENRLNKKPSPYNQFTFRGRSNLNTGFFLNYSLLNFSFFSEASKSTKGGTAWIAGVLGSLSTSFDWSLVVRSFSRDFYSFYGNALSENTNPQNEKGIYWGWKYRFNRKISCAGYLDLFSFPWLRYRSYRPSHGSEWLLRLDYLPSRKVSMAIQLRAETKDRNLSIESPAYQIQPGRKQNLMVSSQYGVGQKLRLKSRIQYSEYSINQHTTSGFAVVQDFHFEQGRFEVNLRYALFDTDDYDNRQYVYENDVWLAYSLPAYDGRGVRKVAMVNYKLNRHLSFWLRFSRTRYADRTASGSGLETIPGDTRDEIKFQAMIRF
jgi:hypothetical protein